MMFSELLVGLLAVEAQISLEEGEKTNYARDIRSAELAVVESAETDSETHVVIPDTRLIRGIGKDKIANELLPFDIEVLEFHKNARARPTKDEAADQSDGWHRQNERTGAVRSIDWRRNHEQGGHAGGVRPTDQA